MVQWAAGRASTATLTRSRLCHKRKQKLRLLGWPATLSVHEQLSYLAIKVPFSMHCVSASDRFDFSACFMLSVLYGGRIPPASEGWKEQSHNQLIRHGHVSTLAVAQLWLFIILIMWSAAWLAAWLWDSHWWLDVSNGDCWFSKQSLRSSIQKSWESFPNVGQFTSDLLCAPFLRANVPIDVPEFMSQCTIWTRTKRESGLFTI